MIHVINLTIQGKKIINVQCISLRSFAFSGFASNEVVNEEKVVKIEESTITIEKYVFSEEDETIFKTCTITIKGTVDGKKIDLKLTYEADDCAKGAVTIVKGVIADIQK